MKIDLIIVRHGFSYSNCVQKHQSFFSQWKRAVFPDPALTKFGVEQIRAIRDHVDFESEVDLVLSSPMLRAVQTAVELFPSRQIWLTPFTKEVHMGVSNSPWTITRQKEHFTEKDWERIHYDFVSDEKGKFSPQAYVADFNQFLKWLAQHLPRVLKLNHVKIKGRKKLTIVLAGHSGMMRKILGLNSRPNNVQAFLLPLKWDVKEEHMSRTDDLKKPKKVVFDGVPVLDQDTFNKQVGTCEV